jgi:hypothetical protein
MLYVAARVLAWLVFGIVALGFHSSPRAAAQASSGVGGALTRLATSPEPAVLPASLSGLEFMIGSWRGEAFGGRIEEHWSGPLGGTMFGMYRLVEGERARLIELITVTHEEERIVYRFNHFHPDLRRWESEPLLYVLVEAGPGRAVFEMAERNAMVPRQLIYERIDEDTLQVGLVGWPGGPEAEEPGRERILFRRSDLR